MNGRELPILHPRDLPAQDLRLLYVAVGAIAATADIRKCSGLHDRSGSVSIASPHKSRQDRLAGNCPCLRHGERAHRRSETRGSTGFRRHRPLSGSKPAQQTEHKYRPFPPSPKQAGQNDRRKQFPSTGCLYQKPEGHLFRQAASSDIGETKRQPLGSIRLGAWMFGGRKEQGPTTLHTYRIYSLFIANNVSMRGI